MYDVAVIGAGHAGCEAALAAARLGDEDDCLYGQHGKRGDDAVQSEYRRNIKGASGKEVDALGGEMGKVIDRTFIQSKMLNRSKGPAVHS